MKYFVLVIGFLISGTAMASEPDNVEKLVRGFYGYFNGKASAAEANKYFADYVIFYIGEMPGVPSQAGSAAKMLDLLREDLCVEECLYTRLNIIRHHVSKDGSASAIVMFFNDNAPENSARDLCNIFSIAKLNGSWKILSWGMARTNGGAECS